MKLTIPLLAATLSVAYGATFGTVVTIGGHASDLALDERRGVLYIANYTGNRVDVLSLSEQKLLEPIRVPVQPAVLAVSPDGRFLVVGHHAQNPPAVTILDLDGNARQTIAPQGQPLAIEFGNSPRALLATTNGIFLLDPATAAFESVRPVPGASRTPFPFPWATFPPEIVQASSTVSRDGNTILIMATPGSTGTPGATGTTGATSNQTYILKYSIPFASAPVATFTTSPPLGPRVISTDVTGRNVLAGWGLLDPSATLLAQIPRANGAFQVGGHAIDSNRRLIYAQFPVALRETPVLHVLDEDNLTVRDRILLPENMAGKSAWSRDGQTLYAVSDSGVLILPIGQLARQPRLATAQESLLFRGNGCDRRTIVATLDIADPGGNRTPFELSVPQSAAGRIRLSQTAGVTPARVTIEVDPAGFQSARGTTVIPLEITSSSAINLLQPIQLLINTRDVDQRGAIQPLPGKLVDILPDPLRNRLYVLRQDKNVVHVLDSTAQRQIAAFRTGNTPTHMAFTRDSRHLLVAADNSQYVAVFDLETLRPADPIVLPGGLYARSIAAARNNTIWVATRSAGAPRDCPTPGTGTPTAPPTATQSDTTHRLVRVDFDTRQASAPCALGIYQNTINVNSILQPSASGRYVFLLQPDGNTVLYDADFDAWAASRKDSTALAGAYASFSDDLFAIGNQFLNRSMVQVRQLDTGTSTPAGLTALSPTQALRVLTTTPTAPGVIDKLDLNNYNVISPVKLAESPITADMLRTPPVGQIGQTILPFTRTLASLQSNQGFAVLTASGLTIVPQNFDASVVNPTISEVVNPADRSSGIAPGGLITIRGAGFTSTPAGTDEVPLPTMLGEVCATVNNVAVPLSSVSSGEIQAQLPNSATDRTTLVVRSAGGISEPFRLTVLPSAPAIFRDGVVDGESGFPLLYRAENEQLVTLSNHVRPGDTLVAFGTGCGRTAPEVEPGFPATADSLAAAALTPTASIGHVQLPVTFAGLVPGFVGVCQINMTVPATVPEGMQMPLTIGYGSYVSTFPVRVVKQ